MSNRWKIERDFFYADLYTKYGQAYIEKIGFFFDTQKENVAIKDSISILCTPLAFIKKEELRDNACVLLSTGSFCPIHEGHVEKIVLAKKQLQENGWNVLGAYLSPGHDEYIELKCGEKAISIEERISLIEEQIKKFPWIHVDPWEGIFNQVAVTYTDVLYRLELYLEKHLGKKIPVFYVCGGDNARFAAAFENKGHCVVVNRPGYENEFEAYKKLANERIVFTNGNNSQSSTKLRENKKSNFLQHKKLLLRTNGHAMEAQLVENLAPYFASIEQKSIAEQQTNFRTLCPTNCISLDAFIPGDYDLKLSRAFDFFGMDQYGYIERPYFESLEKQVQKIPKGNYLLFDDDIHSGSTMRFVTDFLSNHGIHCEEYCSFTHSHKDGLEILDAHDFILGGENNGLVVKLPNGLYSRAPYVYPYVNVTSRCSIPKGLSFSIAVWEMNFQYFKNRNSKVSDLYAQKNLFHYLGFSDETFVSEICTWHLNLLKGFQKPSAD